MPDFEVCYRIIEQGRYTVKDVADLAAAKEKVEKMQFKDIREFGTCDDIDIETPDGWCLY